MRVKLILGGCCLIWPNQIGGNTYKEITMINKIIPIIVIILAVISAFSLVLSLLFSLRYKKDGFITKKTLYTVTFFLLLFWISGTIAFVLVGPNTIPGIIFVSCILLVGILLNFGVGFINLSIMDKKNLRKKISDTLMQTGKNNKTNLKS